MNQDFNKVFKTPKYTGVTLALLSMFVLACMMAVWNKLSVQTSGENQSTSMQIICEKDLEGFIRPSIKSFFRETGFNSRVSFVSSKELQSLISDNAKSKVFFTSNKNKLELNDFKSESFFEEIIVGYLPTTSEIQPTPNAHSEPIGCAIGKGVKIPSHAFALCRFITSPDQGHSILEKNGFIPHGGDNWQITPAIVVYATPELREDLSIPLAEFSKRESVQVELNIKSLNSIEKTVSLIAKSQAKQYLPDVLFGYIPDTSSKDLYFPFFKDTSQDKVNICYISHSSKVWHTCQRLALSVKNYLKK